MKKITPCLWFDKNAEEAAKFYTSIIKNSKITGMTRYDDSSAKAANMPKGTVMTVSFTLNKQEFMALNGGPIFKFNEAISFMLNCDNQEEIDEYWEKLSEGGEKVECGWLKDKFGLSWQIVPAILEEMMSNKDKEKSKRVMGALLKMKKIEIKKLEEAFRGNS